MSTKKKTRRAAPAKGKSSKKTHRQPVVKVHRWFNPFHNHVHANLRRWLFIAGAMLILVLGPVLFD